MLNCSEHQITIYIFVPNKKIIVMSAKIKIRGIEYSVVVKETTEEVKQKIEAVYSDVTVSDFITLTQAESIYIDAKITRVGDQFTLNINDIVLIK